MKFEKIEFAASYGTSQQLPTSSLPEIVFSGKSNVGKSSLINKVFNRKNLARVSSVPGKTITVNFFKGDGVFFVDLPGYGYAKREKTEMKRWAELMEAYFRTNRRISLVIQLLDMRHEPTDEDMMMLDYLHDAEIPFIIALTKCDKLNKTETEKRREELKAELEGFEEVPLIEFSAIKGTGVDEVKKYITDCVK